MVFNSLSYAVFLPVVLAAYWLIGRRRPQNYLLLAASYLFYAMWDWRFLGLMMLSTVVDFFVGRYLEIITNEKHRKMLFATSLIVNLGVLGFFKYYDFFVESAAELMRTVGISPNEPVLRVLLPVGISFYTFHGISYTFDVYRREIRACRHPIDFACFVAYFPQLVAGPIGRAHIQLPQFENPRQRPSRDNVGSGVFLILQGLFKKVAIADVMAPIVNDAFGHTKTASSLTLIAGVYAFALQIYGDFSGYTDVARGSSRLFGIELIRNFEQPYLSRNITEFWRRWHISLSTWLRDYLYIPLGGNRGSEAKTYRNLMLTMVIGGLWHGPAWTFVIWGALNGAFLCGHRWYEKTHVKQRDNRWILKRDLVATVVTFNAVCFTWIFFRSLNLNQAIDYIHGILFNSHSLGAIDSNTVVLLLYAAVLSFGIDFVQRSTGVQYGVLKLWALPRGMVFGSFFLAIIIFSGGTPVPFIYFQF